MIEGPHQRITRWEFNVSQALEKSKHVPGPPGVPSFDADRGWFTVTQIVDRNKLEGPSIRPALNRLCDAGLAQSKPLESGRYFRTTDNGRKTLDKGYVEEDDPIVVNSASWTGIIEPVQVAHVMVILNDMEDACERITDNQQRAQIFGLIRALEILVNVPEPPRQGVVSLLRDPAFANIVQVATFMAALIAAVKP